MSGFNPERLHEIRIVRNMTQEKLADVLGVTKQAISKYEHGKSIPSLDAIDKIATVLKMPREYLLKENVVLTSNSSPLFFRASSSTTKSHIEYANIVSLWGYEIARELDGELPQWFDFTSLDNFSITEKTIKLRELWDIGTSPIKNMTDLLEKHGFYIFTIDSAELETDAYSRIINGVPVIILNKHKGTAVRWRFNLAHELGHLIMHTKLQEWEFSSSKKIEQEANLFAEYFLMPRKSFGKSLFSPKLDYYITLKEQWGVSIAAIIYHCGQLGMLDLNKVKSLQIQMSAHGWNKKEPLDDIIKFEKPQKISRFIFDRVSNSDSFVDFYKSINLPLSEIERICSLPDGYLGAYESGGLREERKGIEFEQLSLFGDRGDHDAK